MLWKKAPCSSRQAAALDRWWSQQLQPVILTCQELRCVIQLQSVPEPLPSSAATLLAQRHDLLARRLGGFVRLMRQLPRNVRPRHVRQGQPRADGRRHAARHYLVGLQRAAHDAAVGEGVLRMAHLRRAVEAYRAHDEQFAEGLRARLERGSIFFLQPFGTCRRGTPRTIADLRVASARSRPDTFGSAQVCGICCRHAPSFFNRICSDGAAWDRRQGIASQLVHRRRMG